MERETMQYRTLAIEGRFEKRSDEEEPRLEGYFSVFGDVYEIYPGITESFAQGAFSDSLSDDVRMLINHDTTFVVGRTKAGTMTLREDTYGLWGSALVNPKDSAAMDAYARVMRGDVTQASIGFEIIEEEAEHRDDGTSHYTIKKVKLWEVSVCTFPAYKATNVSARQQDRREALRRRSDAWAQKAKERLKNGT